MIKSMREKQLLFDLILIALGEKDCLEYDSGIDPHYLIDLIRGQKLVPMLWPVIHEQSDEKWKIITSALKKDYDQAIHKSLMQQIDIENLLHCLVKEEEHVLPLKGWVIRDYYPDSSYRSMLDFDILIKDYNREKYSLLMKKLGYELVEFHDDYHDVYHKKPYTVVELHMSLSNHWIENQKTEIDKWLDTIWDRALLKNESTTIYYLKDEDFYLYHLIHMYKHMWERGVGIRPLIDLYVLLKKQQNEMNWKYIYDSLEKMKLSSFEHQIKKLCKIYISLENNNPPKDMRKLMDFMLSVQLYSVEKNEMANRMAKSKNTSNGGKLISVLFSTIFLPLNEMTIRFPILKKMPWMLPFCCFFRIFKMAFEGKIREFFRGCSKESYQQMEEIYRIAGMK